MENSNSINYLKTRRLKKGDVVEVKYDKSIEEANKMKIIPIRICYEDDYLAVVWKPSGQPFAIFEKAIQFNIALKDLEGNLRKVWCVNEIQKAASGLIIVAKTEASRDILTEQYNSNQIQTTMRILCHGYVTTTATDELFKLDVNKKTESIVPGQVLNSIAIVSQTPSNNAQYISRLDVELCTPILSTQLRKLFYFHSDHPIIGNSTFTRPLKTNRDKGLCAALIAVAFTHPVELNTQIAVEQHEPAKFGVMCEREARSFQSKLDREADEIKKSNVPCADVEQRKQGQLLAYMLGQKEFCGLMYKITSDCLIPRTSSETLVQAAVVASKSIDSESIHVIDVGTGCGNLLISILDQISCATGVGVDISEAALNVAKENASRLLSDQQQQQRATWRIQDMTSLNDQNAYDILVCNPPYLDFDKAKKSKEQMIALRQEPAEALFAKDLGYEWYHVLSKVAPVVVKDHGYVILECGKGMMEKVLAIWSDWKQVAVYKDAQGWDRCLVLQMRWVA
ncbi:S-adenosyl-L-methionine-dependent methyltransferase [Parasitella parasitica]|nr:S-adenosyl-L-methionine-dependent methyltransferase [Parasitella parasitica]